MTESAQDRAQTKAPNWPYNVAALAAAIGALMMIASVAFREHDPGFLRNLGLIVTMSITAAVGIIRRHQDGTLGAGLLLFTMLIYAIFGACAGIVVYDAFR